VVVLGVVVVVAGVVDVDVVMIVDGWLAVFSLLVGGCSRSPVPPESLQDALLLSTNRVGCEEGRESPWYGLHWLGKKELGLGIEVERQDFAKQDPGNDLGVHQVIVAGGEVHLCHHQWPLVTPV
jgi:hypothetical protein